MARRSNIRTSRCLFIFQCVISICSLLGASIFRTFRPRAAQPSAGGSRLHCMHSALRKVYRAVSPWSVYTLWSAARSASRSRLACYFPRAFLLTPLVCARTGVRSALARVRPLIRRGASAGNIDPRARVVMRGFTGASRY